MSRYKREGRSESPVLQALDRLRVEQWRAKDAIGSYLRHLLHVYFIWNPKIHHQSPDFEWKKKMRVATACEPRRNEVY